jgi:hypothetical protein
MFAMQNYSTITLTAAYCRDKYRLQDWGIEDPEFKSQRSGHQLYMVGTRLTSVQG